MAIEVKVEPESMRRVQRELAGIRNGVPRAISGAVKRTADTARSRIVKAVAGDVNIVQRHLYERNNKRRPIRQRFIRDGSMIIGAEINVTGARIPLGRFAARQTRQGVSYRIDKTGGRKKITDAFIPKLSSGYKGVFMRGAGRKMIQLYGPSIPHVAENRPDVQAVLNFDASNIFQKNLDSQVDRLLRRSRNG